MVEILSVRVASSLFLLPKLLVLLLLLPPPPLEPPLAVLGSLGSTWEDDTIRS